MFDLEGFILAGGASKRMGTDKSRLTLQGRTFVDRSAAALESVTTQISIVSARWPKGVPASYPLVPDIYRDCGALGGLHAALTTCRTPWAMVISCDLPFVTGELLRHLAARRSDEWAAIVPLQIDGQPQPLCALYAREPCLERAEQLLQTDERRMRALLRQVPARFIGAESFGHLDDADLFFINVNTPADFALARQRAGEEKSQG